MNTYSEDLGTGAYQQKSYSNMILCPYLVAQVIGDMLGESYRIQTDGKTYLKGFCFLILGEIVGVI